MILTRRQMTDRIANGMPWLDKAAASLKLVSEPIFGPKGPRAVKDALYGTWLGHPLHPLVTDLPIGFWTSSLALDLVGNHQGADLALKAGTISALGAAATGVAQWQDLQELDQPRRLGALHATMNAAATGLYGVSWYLRSHDLRNAGIACSTISYGIVMASSWIGGDLIYRLGIGVSRIAFEETDPEWINVLAESDLMEGELTKADARDVSLVLYKKGNDTFAITATCSHLGGPLDQGEVRDGCVVCPWHQSEFNLATGKVVHGPATEDARVFQTRTHEGQIQVCPAKG
ncbi:MAG: Rieske 2Fe-2S domain-containing protein [Thermomicrobiales bacterium]